MEFLKKLLLLMFYGGSKLALFFVTAICAFSETELQAS